MVSAATYSSLLRFSKLGIGTLHFEGFGASVSYSAVESSDAPLKLHCLWELFFFEAFLYVVARLPDALGGCSARFSSSISSISDGLFDALTGGRRLLGLVFGATGAQHWHADKSRYNSFIEVFHDLLLC